MIAASKAARRSREAAAEALAAIEQCNARLASGEARLVVANYRRGADRKTPLARYSL